MNNVPSLKDKDSAGAHESLCLRLVGAIERDFRYAMRQWLGRPVLAGTAILTLAITIGASTAVFQVFDQIVLRSLPVERPDQLVVLQGRWDGRQQRFSYPLVREMNAQQTTTDGIFASASVPIRTLEVEGREITEPFSAHLATGNYFQLMGVSPQLGSFFTSADDEPGGSAVVVVSDRFWRTQLGARPSALGTTIRVNGTAATVIGVGSQGFSGERIGLAADLWMPMGIAEQLGLNRNLSQSLAWLEPMARLRTDVPLSQAQTEFSVLWGRFRDLSVRTVDEVVYDLRLESGRQGLDVLQSRFTFPLWLLMSTSTLLTLIACASLANLFLARVTSRMQEFRLRFALGAGRVRLIRQLFAESVVVVAAGGTVGMALAIFLSRSLVRLASASEAWSLQTDMDLRTAVFVAGASMATLMAFGIAPALITTSERASSVLQLGSRTNTRGIPFHRFTRLFLIGQVSLSMILITGASLLVSSFWNVTHQEFGYDTRSSLIAPLGNNGAPFDEFLGEQMNRRIALIAGDVPGVSDAAVTAAGLLSTTVQFPEEPASAETAAVGEGRALLFIPASERYIEAIGAELIRGRSLADGDSRRVAVITATAARLLFGSEDPVGQRFSHGVSYDSETAFEVSGVVEDIRFGSLREAFRGIAFVPIGQVAMPTSPTLVVRTIGEPSVVVPRLQEALESGEPRVRLIRTELLHEIIQSEASRERLLAWLAGGFGFIALLLAAVALYGVASYAVELRRRELGIRMALGAGETKVRALVLWDMAVAVVPGLGVGAIAAVLLSQSLRSMLFAISPQDPYVLAAAALMISVVALAGAYIPTRRLSRIDPLEAVTSEY